MADLKYASMQIAASDANDRDMAQFRAEAAEAKLAKAVDEVKAVIRNVWSMCEEIEDMAYEKLKDADMSDHERGFHGGMKFAAKSIRRANNMPIAAPEDRATLAEIGVTP